MRVATLDERFADFLAQPTPDCWLAVRSRVLARPDFDPYAPEWQQLESWFAAREYGRLLEASESMSQTGCLSARFHFLVGVSALETGDVQRAHGEKRCTQLCLQAILDTGNGTAAAPYLSTYPWDCYDVLQALGLESSGQHLVDADGQWCDVLTVTNGEECWFDVTDLLEHRARARRGTHLATPSWATDSSR